MSNVASDLEEARAELLSATGALSEFLRRYEEWHWANYVDRARQRIQDEGASGADDLLRAYGGMGSLNDVVIHPANGHALAAESIDAVNTGLGQLRSRTYAAAVKLKTATRSAS